ncbi:MAG: hypothetical protein D9V44_09030 [Actinobacteria bacterium]|nr:MAG: hypothetical protein D9V44_09030 [Actinomycetota bacterium]
MRSTVIRIAAIAALATLIVMVPSVVLAFDETTSTLPPSMDEANCGGCHDPWPGSVFDDPKAGVHGGYTITTSKCGECHSVHQAPASSVMLLPGATTKATCMTCHDGTAGGGVYGAIAARGRSVGSSHSVEAINVVPGGDENSGGSLPVAFGGPGGTLTCTSCHSPHGADVVNAYAGERQRSATWGIIGVTTSSKLLKRSPGNSTTPTAEYGSDWCLGCHKGRSSGLSAAHNHPADSKATTATPFTYTNVAKLNGDALTGVTVLGTLAGSNRGYLMPWPRTAQQTGHAPICQQCHEDSRMVGSLSADGTQGDAAPYTITTPDGWTDGDNPRFQNFPHETQNYRMLVEATSTAYYDDLCLNCHPVVSLP